MMKSVIEDNSTRKKLSSKSITQSTVVRNHKKSCLEFGSWTCVCYSDPRGHFKQKTY